VPRFYFDYRSGEELAVDDTGTVLRDIAQAKAEAITAAGEWVKDKTASGAAAELRLSVRDGSGAPLFVVAASIGIAPVSE
jgi:hypothetical protein